MPEKVLRLIFILLFTVLGVVLSRQGESVLTALLPSSVLTETILGITFMSLATMLLGGILGAVVGCAVSPYLISRLFALTSRMEKSLSAMSTQDLIAGTLGLFLGLIIANLVGLAFSSVPFIGPYVSVVLSIVLGCISQSARSRRWSAGLSCMRKKRARKRNQRKNSASVSCWIRISSSMDVWQIFSRLDFWKGLSWCLSLCWKNCRRSQTARTY